jgi:hypothetical protein
MQFSAYPALMQDIGITDASWFDIYVDPDRKTMQAAAVFNVDKTRQTLIRLRPSLLDELELTDCPGINDFIADQPRNRLNKRSGAF